MERRAGETRGKSQSGHHARHSIAHDPNGSLCRRKCPVFPPAVAPQDRTRRAAPESEQSAKLVSSTQSLNFDDSRAFDFGEEISRRKRRKWVAGAER